MVTQMPTKASLEAQIAELESGPQTSDTREAITRVRSQLAHLEEFAGPSGQTK